jgi:hypothetical protein
MSIGEAGGLMFLGFAVLASALVWACMLYYWSGGR